MKKILLITPPFTQLNTPYPATPYLAGFLKLHGYEVFQADLGIDLISRIFTITGFRELFAWIREHGRELSDNSYRILQNETHYVETVDQVMHFLRLKDNTPARRIATGALLPRASRFDQMPDPDLSFGRIGVNDQARFMATLYLEDVGDLIRDAVTPYFGFSRYAEKLGTSARSFSLLAAALQQPPNLIESWLLELLKDRLDRTRPEVVGITIPFPGNLYAALRCGGFIRERFPGIAVVAGGGYANTELRDLAEPAVFDFVDYITLDDGERPLLNILHRLSGRHEVSFKRTFLRSAGRVRYIEGAGEDEVLQADAGCPDYSGLSLDSYLSLIEIANPMHRLWSDGQWNKLTIAHGCYWHKCSFCDTTLDYIRRCDSAPAAVLADRIERIIGQTGHTGFHFVDEAAPPGLLKELALELLKRRLTVSWWANIRFENAFTDDLCRLLAASGCIAVTGGLEAASGRLLKLMNKGVTVPQAARVCRNFTESGILVHAYLMYGLPTQTARETVDSLEIVRQFFEEGLIRSAFWHLFTVTVHSDAGRNPEKYHIRIVDPLPGSFARNDLVHQDPLGCDHHAFASGLKRALYNFLHGIGTDFPVREWFDFPVPRVSVARDYVARASRRRPVQDSTRQNAKVLWLENQPRRVWDSPRATGKDARKATFVFFNRTETFTLSTDATTGKWLDRMFKQAQHSRLMTLGELKLSYEKSTRLSFDSFVKSREWKTLRRNGLLLI